MTTPIPAVAHFAGATPAFSTEQEFLLRAADQLRVRLKRAPRLTELLQMLQTLGYRRLSAEQLAAYETGRLHAAESDVPAPDPDK